MVTNSYTKEIDDLIYLLSCSIRGLSPDVDRVDNMDLSSIYQLASYHSVAAMTAFALEQAISLPSDFDQAKKKAIRKLALFDIERGKLFKSLDDNQIWYLPLKGIILKDYYPRYGMREMADNDILCEIDRMPDVKRILEGFGFHCERFGRGVHDIYSKPPLSFEIHRSLFDEKETKDLYDYYKDVKQKLIHPKEGSFGFSFTDEDFYLYLLAHEYKHYLLGGTGIRSLIDTFVFLEHCSQLDRNYIDKELQKLGMTDFEKLIRNLSKAIFSDRPLTDAEKESLLFFVSSGTYGRLESYYQNYMIGKVSDNSKKAKIAYVLKRIFVSGEELRTKFPFYYRHKVLLPALYIQRIFKAIFIKPKAVRSELKVLQKYNKED